MNLERFTPENTCIVMLDYSVGFMNLFRSHPVNEHLRNATSLAKMGVGFGTGFVVNVGAGQTLYPQIVEAIGDHPIITRGGEYNVFENAKVRKAIEDTGRSHLAIGGISTEGCVLFSVLGALRLGYTVAIVEDATAGESPEAHEMAMRRMVQAGVVPTTWLSFATELQYDWSLGDSAQVYFDLIKESEPGLMLGIQMEHANAEANAG